MKTRPAHRLTARERRSVALSAVYSGTFFGVVNTLVSQLLIEPLPLHVGLVQGVLTGVFFGAFMGGVMAFNLKRAGGHAGSAAVMGALRTRTLSDVLDPQTWDLLLSRQERSLILARLYAAFFVVASILIAVIAATGEPSRYEPFLWGGAVLMFALAIVTVLEARVRRAKVRGLREQLATG
ncbi:hypothetical protein [Marisediminicola sp. LYQ85]|uniref:hypothetical protein n=1 Tax=Marisediminicola sp. LYQ85 TaxID=3391062 RepID=UPI003982F7BB